MNAAPITVMQDVTRRAWWLYAAAVASSIPTLWFYLVGEEGILVNASLEMWQRGDWLRGRIRANCCDRLGQDRHPDQR